MAQSNTLWGPVLWGGKQCFETIGTLDYLNGIESDCRGHVCNYICNNKTHFKYVKHWIMFCFIPNWNFYQQIIYFKLLRIYFRHILNVSYLTINWGMYVCVCLSVCLSVCPAIRFHISQRIFSKFGGNLLRVMTRSVGYTCCVCTQRARMRMQCARINRVRMLHETNYRHRFIYRHCVLNSDVYSKRSNGFSPNLLGTYYYSP
jgi:hypothetical protein